MNIIAKTILTTSLIGLTSFATANTAVNQSALTPSLTTVKQALTLKDDTKVQLRGNVVKAIGDEKYQFRDSTGSITVDIDDELWQGKPIAANAILSFRFCRFQKNTAYDFVKLSVIVSKMFLPKP